MSSSTIKHKQLLFLTNYQHYEGRHMNKYSIIFLLLLTLGPTLFAQDLAQPLNSESDQFIEETELTTEQKSNSSDLFTKHITTSIDKEVETSVFKPPYTLMRFTGGAIFNTTGSIDKNNEDIDIELNHIYYTGKEHTYGFYFGSNVNLRNYIEEEKQITSLSLEANHIQGQYMITPGHVLYFMIIPKNIWASATLSPNANVTNLGTERPAVTYNNYGSKLLTNDGEIKISSLDYQLAFFNGPMLNKMQYKHTIQVWHQWWDDTSLDNMYYSGEFGLLNNFSFGSSMALNRDRKYYELLGYDENGFAQYGEKDYYDKFLTFKLHGRTEKVFGTLSYIGNKNSESKIDFLSALNKTGSLITLSGGYLHGTRELTFANVNGNWDNYYDQTLGKGQILGTADLYIAPYMDDGKSTNDINAKLDGTYGISDEINAGAIYYRNGGKGSAGAQNTFIIKAAYCSVPLRNYGPGAAPILEYHYGKKPGPGEFKADAWLKLPIADNHSRIEYDLTAPQQELFTITAATGLAGGIYGEGSLSYDDNEDGDNQNITLAVTGGIQTERSQFFISWNLQVLEESNEFGALSAGARILF